MYTFIIVIPVKANESFLTSMLQCRGSKYLSISTIILVFVIIKKGENVRTLEQGLRLPHILMITNVCVILISNADSKSMISKAMIKDTWIHGHTQ